MFYCTAIYVLSNFSGNIAMGIVLVEPQGSYGFREMLKANGRVSCTAAMSVY
jgi:hypothetical protein